ncbi:MAG: hypothetical protein HP477_12585 [Nitrospira sp.]|nr:hypothetical protein [Nitrospira sp.]
MRRAPGYIGSPRSWRGPSHSWSSGQPVNRARWSFVAGEPIVHRWKRMTDVPATNPISDTLSKDLKRRGFRFVGSTIVYAYMQAVGLVNDHTEECFRKLTPIS